METKFNFNSQVCTSKIQSERLLALGLKKETADMKHIPYTGDIVPKDYDDGFSFNDSEYIPAWSLHRLLEMNLNSTDTRFEVRFNQLDVKDAYEILLAHIEWLIKEGYFNKEYLNENI